MVSGLGSTRGELNHFKSHREEPLLLKNIYCNSISAYIQHGRIHHIKHQPQELQTPLKQNRIH